MNETERGQRLFLAAWCRSFGRPSREMYQGVREKYELAASGADWDDSAPVLRNDHPWRGQAGPRRCPLPPVAWRPVAPPSTSRPVVLQLPPPAPAPVPRSPWWSCALGWLKACFRRL